MILYNMVVKWNATMYKFFEVMPKAALNEAYGELRFSKCSLTRVSLTYRLSGKNGFGCSGRAWMHLSHSVYIPIYIISTWAWSVMLLRHQWFNSHILYIRLNPQYGKTHTWRVVSYRYQTMLNFVSLYYFNALQSFLIELSRVATKRLV